MGADLVLGLLDRGLIGIGILAAIGLFFAIKHFMSARSTSMKDVLLELRNDNANLKAENRDLETALDAERARRRAAEDVAPPGWRHEDGSPGARHLQ